ncbi:hypothetical protein BG004_001594, partial [Podila humilis]
MRFSIIAIVTTLISSVLAQQVYPTAPIETTKWNAGSVVTIRWKINRPAPTKPLNIELLTGTTAAAQHIVADLGTSPVGATSFKATLPAGLASGWYSIRIGGDSYSAFFTLVGKGPVPTVPAPPSVNATTTALPSATSTVLTNVTTTATTTTTTLIKPSVTAPPGTDASDSGAGQLARVGYAAVAIMAA